MEKVIYAKYNKSRKESFRIGTKVCVDEGVRFVVKFPLTNAAKVHMNTMLEFYDGMKAAYENVDLLLGKKRKDGIQFEYIKGETAGDYLLKQLEIKDRDSFLDEIENVISRIFKTGLSVESFEKTELFSKVFGDVNLSGDLTSLPWTNIDMIPDNLIIRDGRYVCIDYEWVFDFPVPSEFVTFRCLYYFYDRNRARLKAKGITENDLYQVCNVSLQNIDAYRIMESGFQQWVFGDENYCERYVTRVRSESVEELVKRDEEMAFHLKKLDVDVANKDERIVDLQEEVTERNLHIEKLDADIQKLTADRDVLNYKNQKNEKLINDKDVHIRNLEALITAKDQCILEKDNHIQNMKPAFDRYMKFRGSLPGKVIRAPKYFARKTVNVVKNSKARMMVDKLIVPSCENPIVSIVIPVYNQFDFTYNCVKSIIENTGDVKYEIIIADDVSTDETRHINRFVRGVRVIRNKTNLKFLLNCNNAAKHAKGSYILFLNNDTQVRKNWLSSMVRLMEKDESIGMTGSKLVYPDGRLQEAGGIVWKDGSAWNYGNGEDPDAVPFNYVREVDYISGASIMIRRNLWEELGGFDEDFAPAYCEDSDLAFQVRRAGYKVVYQPESVVVHFEGVSNGTDTSTGLKHYQVVNSEKLKEKWADELKTHFNNGEHVLKAKDRCYGNGKVILFIDHYVPQFDKDAGSRTVYQYVKMFVKKGYVVKFIGDNYFKHEPYTTILNQMGVEVLHGPWYAQNIFKWLEDNAADIDYVFMNRPHITEKYIDFFKEHTDCRIIYYGHDLHFLRITREYELSGEEEKHLEAEEWKEKEMSIMHKADVIYYPSDVEAKLLKSIDNGINVKALVPYVYDEFKDYDRNSSKNNGILFVGGFAHTPNIDAVKWFVEHVYTKIRARADIPFYVVGSNPPEEITALDGDGVVIRGFVSDEELEELYNSCKLVVVPLRYGAGVKGKVVEAIYNGVPIVTTSVGAEGIPNCEDVLVIKDDVDEFADAVVRLYSDDKMLDELSKKMQAYIKKYNSVEAAWSIVGSDFQ